MYNNKIKPCKREIIKQKDMFLSTRAQTETAVALQKYLMDHNRINSL